MDLADDLTDSHPLRSPYPDRGHRSDLAAVIWVKAVLPGWCRLPGHLTHSRHPAASPGAVRKPRPHGLPLLQRPIRPTDPVVASNRTNTPFVMPQVNTGAAPCQPCTPPWPSCEHQPHRP